VYRVDYAADQWYGSGMEQAGQLTGAKRGLEAISTAWATAILAAVASAMAAEPWPAESNAQAVKLTDADPELNAVNMSGVSWNPVTRALWLANNSGRYYAMVEDGPGRFRIATNSAGVKARWAPGGDLESICQADFAGHTVFLLDENGWIREHDVAQYGVVRELRKWDIRGPCPEVHGAGPEGLTFVPDEWLAKRGFAGADGRRHASTNGMGGLMFVGHQNGGHIHVFDLNRANGGYGYVGRYATGREETAGLEFDRVSGRLFVWHNTGANYLEVADLASSADGSGRRLRQIAEYTGPRRGNIEGFAVVPADSTNTWCFLADDDNQNGEAVMWYRRFKLPPAVAGAGRP
jgi:hypothetical protein